MAAMKEPKAFRHFREVMSQVVQVPKYVIDERMEEHRRKSAENPNRRGPKPKSKRQREPQN